MDSHFSDSQPQDYNSLFKNPPPSKSKLPTARVSLTTKNRQPGSSRLSVISSNPRSSIAPTRPTPYARGTPTVNEMMAASVKRTSMRSSSIAFSQQQQGSVGRSRQSTVPGFSTSSLSNGNGLTLRDPRPLRDKTYQAKIAQETFDYLVNNKFEIEMRHPLTQKTLKAPTQKDFVFIFQWLYKRLDPGYKFTRSIEHEVYSLLKHVEYPFLDSINKSQISAVGGQNWPYYLGMLHWLVKLNRSLDAFENKEYDAANLVDDDTLDQIFMRYVSKSYKAFLANEDDYSEYQEEMNQEFEQHSLKVNELINAMKEEEKIREKKLQELEKSVELENSLEKKGEVLNGDYVKFKAYIESMERRKLKWGGVLSKIKEELAAADVDLKEIHETNKRLEQKIKEQGLEPAEIDRINSEREKLGKSIDQVNVLLDEMAKVCKNKELIAQKELEELKLIIDNYNAALDRLSARPKDEIGQEIDLSLSLNASLDDESLECSPEELLNGKSIAREIRPTLQKFRLEINDDVNKMKDEQIQLHEQIDQVSEDITEKKEKIANLEAKLNSMCISYDTLYDTMHADAATSKADIDKLERDLQNMELSFKQEKDQVNQRSQTTDIEHKQLKLAVQQERERIHKEVERIIVKVTGFKVDIQELLEEHENLVVNEWNDRVVNELNDTNDSE